MKDLSSTRMTGGEITGEQKVQYLRLENLISDEPDVYEVHELMPLPEEGRWLYLVETPYATFPKFVIGSTDADNSNPEILFQSGAEWSARAEWDRLKQPTP
jgi:hypothetical protein